MSKKTPKIDVEAGQLEGRDEGCNMGSPSSELKAQVSLNCTDFSAASPASLMLEVRKRMSGLHQPHSMRGGGLSKRVLHSCPTAAAVLAVSTTPSQLPHAKAAEHRYHISLNIVTAFLAFLLGALAGCWMISELEWHTTAQDRAPGEAGGLSKPESGVDLNQSVVADLAIEALLARYGFENVTLSHSQEVVRFRRDGAGRNDSEAKPCDPLQDPSCLEAHVLGMRSGDRDPSLIVVVPPGADGSWLPAAGGADADADGRAEHRDAGEQLQLQLEEVRVVILIALAVVLPLTFLGINAMVSRPLRRLSHIVKKLGDLDLECSLVDHALHTGPRSRILEVAMLQGALDRFVHGLETFRRFMPMALARSIVLGDERSMRLHVAARDVTIMFSDVKDFTSICEGLSQKDLLFVVTRYLSVMTRVVEMYNGTVSEILGDGLLVFWNTPDDVPDHASKACTTALVQQRALDLLNDQFAPMNLPKLAIRIGLHTGSVLSGTLGSEMRMKFGCMGDSVNLASRLEGLCKHYGVEAICSEATCEALAQEPGFLFRRLDLVQVKGRQEPTMVYELIGKKEEPCVSMPELEAMLPEVAADLGLSNAWRSERSSGDAEGPDPFGCASLALAERMEAARKYEDALAAFQEGRLAEAREQCQKLLEARADDLPATRLLERASRHLDTDGHVCLTPDEMASWTGVSSMEEK